MILYLSGPITGELNYQTNFYMAHILVTFRGHDALNPAFLPKGIGYRAAMDIDLTMLKHADGIVMLQGWKKSRGARRELKEAIRLGLKVYYGADSVPRTKEAKKWEKEFDEKRLVSFAESPGFLTYSLP